MRAEIEPEPAPTGGSDEAGHGPIARNFVSLLTSQFLTWTIGVAPLVLLPRYLGATEFGELSIAQALWGILGVLISFGLPTYLTRLTAREPGQSGPTLASVLVVQVALYALAWLVAVAFVLLVDVSDRTATVVVVYGMSGLFAGYAASTRGVLEGLERMTTTAIADVAAKFASTAAMLLIMLLGGDVRVIAVTGTVAALVNLTVMAVALRADDRVTLPRLGSEEKPTPPALVVRGAAGLMLVDLSVVLYRQIDTFVIAVVADERTVGWYASADRLAGNSLFIPVALGTAVFPAFTRTVDGDPTASTTMLLRMASTVVALTAPLGIALGLLGDRIAVLLFGEAFRPVGDTLAVFGVVIVLTSVAVIFGRYAVATDRERTWLLAMVGLAAATIPLDLVLVPWTDQAFENGSIGGALAFLVTESAIVIFALWLFVRGRGIPLAPVSRQLLAIAGSALAMAGVILLLSELALLPLLAISSIVYAAVLLPAGGLDDAEMSVLRARAGRVMNRINRRDHPQDRSS